MKREMTFTVILQPETASDFRGYYNASVPALPGCLSYGATREAAVRNVREAVELYLEELELLGESIPDDRTEILREAGISREELESLLK